VRVFSTDCPLEASGMSVTWLENVDPRVWAGRALVVQPD